MEKNRSFDGYFLYQTQTIRFRKTAESHSETWISVNKSEFKTNKDFQNFLKRSDDIYMANINGKQSYINFSYVEKEDGETARCVIKRENTKHIKLTQKLTVCHVMSCS
jgi:hypothetical protein